jgi:hypothetical protein
VANSTVNTYGTTKGGSETFANTAGQEIQSLYNSRGDHLVANSLPRYAELVRLGNTWSMRTATASAFNAVAALPTTLGAAILFNGESAGGKSYIIHNIFCTTIVTAAAATQYSLLAQVLPSPLGAATAPTHSASTTILTSRSGKPAYTGMAKRAINVTTFFTDGWDVVGTTGGLAAANVGGGVFADVDGSIIIPPQGALGMNVVAGTVNTAGMVVGCTWSEVQLTLG